MRAAWPTLAGPPWARCLSIEYLQTKQGQRLTIEGEGWRRIGKEIGLSFAAFVRHGSTRAVFCGPHSYHNPIAKGKGNWNINIHFDRTLHTDMQMHRRNRSYHSSGSNVLQNRAPTLSIAQRLEELDSRYEVRNAMNVCSHRSCRNPDRLYFIPCVESERSSGETLSTWAAAAAARHLDRTQEVNTKLLK